MQKVCYKMILKIVYSIMGLVILKNMIYCGCGVDGLMCPDPRDIQPCICTNTSINLDMECSQVLDEYQLASVFMAYFPNSTFRKLTIKDNPWLTILPTDVFGSVSFQTIMVARGVLQTIEEGAFTASSHTVEWLYFYDNKLSSFPFTDLPLFVSMEMLDLSDNQIQEIPNLSSVTLQRFYIDGNPLNHLSNTTFINTPSLTTVYLQETGLTQIYSDTFSGLQKLVSVYLFRNKLTYVPESMAQFYVKESSVFLSINNISHVAVNAFPGMMGGMIEIQNNALTQLVEEVWRPLLEEGVNIKAFGNPLTCGCDIAWLVNSSFIGQIDPMFTQCANGTLVAFLDPAGFQHC